MEKYPPCPRANATGGEGMNIWGSRGGEDLATWWATHCSGTKEACCAACPYDDTGDTDTGIRCGGAGGGVDYIYLNRNALTGTIRSRYSFFC